jgi:hypothetical protein
VAGGVAVGVVDLGVSWLTRYTIATNARRATQIISDVSKLCGDLGGAVWGVTTGALREATGLARILESAAFADDEVDATDVIPVLRCFSRSAF